MPQNHKLVLLHKNKAINKRRKADKIIICDLYFIFFASQGPKPNPS